MASQADKANGATPKAAERKRLTEPMMGPSPPRDLYLARIGSSLTPRRISSILSLCDQGQPAQYHDLLNELRQKDGHLHSVLQTRESALLAAGWTIQAPEVKEETRELAEEAAAYCREVVAALANFEPSVSHLADALYKGYAVCEVIFERRGKYVVPVALEPKQGRRFAFDQESRLRWYDDGLKPFPGDDFLTEYPRKFLVHQPRVTGDSPVREGLGRILCWLACFRNWAWRDWMLFSELYGKPWRIVQLDRTKAQDEDEEAARQIVNDATSSTALLIYDSMTLDIRWPEAAGGAQATPSPQIISTAGQDMSLAVLGQLGTTGDVQNGLGGKGDAREQVRRDLLKADDRAMSATLRRLLATIVMLGPFPMGTPVPVLSFNTEDALDTKGFLDTIKVATEVGVQVPVAYVHDQTGIPRPVDDEPVLGSGVGATIAEEPEEDDEPASEPMPDEGEGDEGEGDEPDEPEGDTEEPADGED